MIKTILYMHDNVMVKAVVTAAVVVVIVFETRLAQ